jgi:Domain of unknown function (DUF1905)
MNSIKFEARIWVWPGDTPWHFVSLSPELSQGIRDKYPKNAMVKVTAKIDDVEWQTALFRNFRDKNYIMPIKKKVRKDADLMSGEVVWVEVVV